MDAGTKRRPGREQGEDGGGAGVGGGSLGPFGCCLPEAWLVHITPSSPISLLDYLTLRALLSLTVFSPRAGAVVVSFAYAFFFGRYSIAIIYMTNSNICPSLQRPKPIRILSR